MKRRCSSPLPSSRLLDLFTADLNHSLFTSFASFSFSAFFATTGINLYVVITFVPPNELITTLMFPLFAGAAVLAIGYRADFQALKMWQERLHYVKEQDAWMATVAHNIGTPLTTISFANSAMMNLKPSKSTLRYLKQQRTAVDYLRGVYTTVMYRRGGKTPILKQQRFKPETLMEACEVR